MLGVLNITSDLQLVVNIALEFGLSLSRLELRFHQVFLGELVSFLSILGAWEGFFLLSNDLLGRSRLLVIHFHIDRSWGSFEAMIRLLSSTRPINTTFRVHFHICFWRMVVIAARRLTLVFIYILLFLRGIFFLVLFATAHYDYNNHNDYRNSNSHTYAYAQLLICSKATHRRRDICVILRRIRLRIRIVVYRISNIRFRVIISIVCCWRIVRIHT